MSLWSHLLESTLCVGAAALLAWRLRHAAARTRHAIWLCASVKFLVPFSVVAAAGAAVGRWTADASDVQAVVRWLSASMPRWYVDAPTNSAAGAPLAIGGTVVLGLALLWAAGVTVLSIWRWRQWQSLSALARKATSLEQGREANALGRIPRGARRPRGIVLLQCDGRLEPGVLGIVRPRILWPAGLSERLSDAELESVLSHEACHVDRRDNLMALLQIVAETLFWFHPAVWWIGTRLVRERERACDEEVLHMGTNKQQYAESILKVCDFCLRAPAAFVAGVGSSPLTERIEWIVKRSSPRAITMPVRVLLAALLAVAIGAPLGAGLLSAHGVPSGLAQQERTVHRPGNGVSQPKLVYEVKPEYTREAMDARIQGTVWLEAVVGETGLVEEVKVTRSLDDELGLDKAAVEALRQWRFEPGKKDDKPVAVRIEVEMSFRLK